MEYRGANLAYFNIQCGGLRVYFDQTRANGFGIGDKTNQDCVSLPLGTDRLVWASHEAYCLKTAPM